MSTARHLAAPLAAGLLAAAVTFAVVLLTTRDDDRRAPRPAAQTPAAAAAGRPDPEAGRAVFARMGCGSCHQLTAAGSRGQIGPSLDRALPRHTRGSLLAQIVHPPAGSMMPGDFARRMSFQDLQRLVDFLVAARDGAR